jgi:hypothetical protein
MTHAANRLDATATAALGRRNLSSVADQLSRPSWGRIVVVVCGQVLSQPAAVIYRVTHTFAGIGSGSWASL